MSILLLILFSPIIAVVTSCLFLQHRGKPFFYQARVGKGNRVFQLIKFKTMAEVRDPEGRVLPDDQRLLRFGKFLRMTSIDELPQLINVVRGEMSLVGPRPLLIDYLPLYSEFQAQRHNVRPGVTCLAQINGRNDIPWQSKFEYDVWYVHHYSIFLDLKILFTTIWNVLLIKGISQAGHVSSENFKGNL